MVVWWHDTCDTCDDMTCLQLSVRTSCVLICCTYLVFHAAFLVINFILLADTESHLQQIAAYTQATESGDWAQWAHGFLLHSYNITHHMLRLSAPSPPTLSST